MWDRIIDGVISGTSGTKPRLQGISNATNEMLAAACWYPREMVEGDIPAGQQIVGWNWIGLVNGKSQYHATYADIPDAIPTRFENGIDIPLLVIDAPSGKGVGLVANEDGTLVPIIYAHESPYDMPAFREKIRLARIAKVQEKAARKTDAQAAKTAASAANSVPALREQVAILAALIEAMA